MHIKSVLTDALALTSCFLGLATAEAATTDYPSRPIKLVVPASAGSSADLAARILAKKLSTILGQSLVIENKVGAGGRIGTADAARATPDGYTLFYGTSITQALYPALVRPLPYDPLRDFVPLGQTFWFATMIVCNSQMPFTDLKGLVDFARDNPEKLSFANSGLGGGNHFSNALFAKAANITIQHIPFRGNAPGIQAVVGNFVNCSSQTEVKSFVEGGQIRAYATTGKDRDPRFPDVPTLGEAGFPAATTTWWHALYAPNGTPAAVVEKLQEAVREFSRDPNVGTQTSEIGLFPQYLGPEEVAQRTKDDIELFGKVARESDLRLD
ncbi:tripartite-type tricarboxylate transporter receptor subunit TctC [Tardiphaga robiniae]|jgi:tripartite-type tricarboxylate transporter receptor subunit TctC|uniref:Bug family tripartite tricarboxylate transporter substrate binding protein n=1 Tax=Tardiphaga robiniae TaxID=943830 RepID=UPI0028565413|nr:tripartite tricarboxylate transporter substrate binding protein [Tardiphaga robiniae]MDR6659361.1 tripartite-type tricarboxylate transporter receptor subunit TctC [Tardiphaga robiniae]